MSAPARPQLLATGIVQMRPEKGRVAANLERIATAIRGGAEAGRDLLVFPEAALSGYALEGAVVEAARTPDEVVHALGSPPSRAPDVVLGFYERGREGIHNSAAYLTPSGDRWELVHLHRKVFLPTYGVFQEGRFLAPGLDLRAFDTRFGRVGLLICEEMLHSICPTLLSLDGAEVLVTLSATPARGFPPGADQPTNLERWEVAGRGIAQEHGVHLVVAQLVGSDEGRLFAGGSTVYDPKGERVVRGPLFEEATLEAGLDPRGVRRARARAPLVSDLRLLLPHLRRGLARVSGEASAGAAPGDPRHGPGDEAPAGGAEDRAASGASETSAAPAGVDPEDASMLEIEPELLERALLSFLREEVREKRGFENVVVGVSGGVDSAVSLHLAVRALGPEGVHAFLLPYATSSPSSLEHGRMLCDEVGVAHRTIPITPAVDGYAAEEPGISDLRRGNLAARTRATILWDQAARLEALPLGTGNKSERLMGFFTWHADDAPPVNPLGDLFKTQVWQLARWLGVPEEVVGKPPSPDLVRGVHDETELGVAYPLADRILHWLLEGFSPEDLVAAGFAEEPVHLVHRRLEGTHWKRRLPTVAMVSSTAIGQAYLRPLDL